MSHILPVLALAFSIFALFTVLNNQGRLWFTRSWWVRRRAIRCLKGKHRWNYFGREDEFLDGHQEDGYQCRSCKRIKWIKLPKSPHPVHENCDESCSFK